MGWQVRGLLSKPEDTQKSNKKLGVDIHGSTIPTQDRDSRIAGTWAAYLKFSERPYLREWGEVMGYPNSSSCFSKHMHEHSTHTHTHTGTHATHTSHTKIKGKTKHRGRALWGETRHHPQLPHGPCLSESSILYAGLAGLQLVYLPECEVIPPSGWLNHLWWYNCTWLRVTFQSGNVIQSMFTDA